MNVHERAVAAAVAARTATQEVDVMTSLDELHEIEDQASRRRRTVSWGLAGAALLVAVTAAVALWPDSVTRSTPPADTPANQIQPLPRDGTRLEPGRYVVTTAPGAPVVTIVEPGWTASGQGSTLTAPTGSAIEVVGLSAQPTEVGDPSTGLVVPAPADFAAWRANHPGAVNFTQATSTVAGRPAIVQDWDTLKGVSGSTPVRTVNPVTGDVVGPDEGEHYRGRLVDLGAEGTLQIGCTYVAIPATTADCDALVEAISLG